MKDRNDVRVAVLLATYNGARFVDAQVRSLKENAARFILHWIDDHSTDDTRNIVRTAARACGLTFREWHQSRHLGVPGAFFQLLECVDDADIYLFCDQDDIWQPHKIDATVASLLPDIDKPILCCSDPLLFRNDNPEIFYRVSELTDATVEVALQESRLFMAALAWGHTQGFTRILRDIFTRHKEIAYSHAWMHDEWIHAIAIASGTVRVLANVPTTLYRWHRCNVTGGLSGLKWNRCGRGRVTMTWRQLQRFRRLIARQASGFVLASPTLPPGPKLDRALGIARIVATLDRRQTPAALIRILRRRIFFPRKQLALGLALCCLWTDAPTRP